VNVAFGTGALAGGLAAVLVVSIAIWIVTLVTGSEAAWAVAPWVLVAAAILVAGGTLLAERVMYRRTMARKRSTGEPWAYREE
jgi:branched-subunit amino acid ABC-type transport system permease component